MIRKFILSCNIALLLSIGAYASDAETLIHTNWQFRQQGVGDWLPAQVPGTVHTDLLENGENVSGEPDSKSLGRECRGASDYV